MSQISDPPATREGSAPAVAGAPPSLPDNVIQIDRAAIESHLCGHNATEETAGPADLLP